MFYFASDYVEGTNPYALYLFAKAHGFECCYVYQNGCMGDVKPNKTMMFLKKDCAITGNARWINYWQNLGVKVNTQHGNFFLGDTSNEEAIDIYLIASPSEANMMLRNGIPATKIRITGCARTDRLFNNDPLEAESFRKLFNIPSDKKIILYAPTYDRRNLGFGEKLFFAQSLSIADDRQMLLELIKGAEEINAQIIIRVHKYYSKKWDKLVPPWLIDLCGNIPITSNATHSDSIPAILASDILITDFSSIVSDFLPFDKKIIFMEPNSKWIYTTKWHATKQERNNIGQIVKNHAEIKSAVVECFDKYTSIFAKFRDQIRQKYVPLFDGKCAERGIGVILDELNRRNQ